MKKHQLTGILLSIALIAVAVIQSDQVCAQEGDAAVESESVLLKPWIGPYGGVPPWRMVKPEEFIGAFEAAIEMSTADIEKIANNSEPASFENTIVPLEVAGRSLDRVATIFDVHASNLNLGPIPDIEMKVQPMLSKHNDSIMQNEKLFARVAAVYEGDEMKRLTPSQQRLVDDRYKSFVRQGAKLGTRTRKNYHRSIRSWRGCSPNSVRMFLRTKAGRLRMSMTNRNWRACRRAWWKRWPMLPPSTPKRIRWKARKHPSG